MCRKHQRVLVQQVKARGARCCQNNEASTSSIATGISTLAVHTSRKQTLHTVRSSKLSVQTQTLACRIHAKDRAPYQRRTAIGGASDGGAHNCCRRHRHPPSAAAERDIHVSASTTPSAPTHRGVHRMLVVAGHDFIFLPATGVGPPQAQLEPSSPFRLLSRLVMAARAPHSELGAL